MEEINESFYKRKGYSYFDEFINYCNKAFDAFGKENTITRQEMVSYISGSSVDSYKCGLLKSGWLVKVSRGEYRVVDKIPNLINSSNYRIATIEEMTLLKMALI